MVIEARNYTAPFVNNEQIIHLHKVISDLNERIVNLEKRAHQEDRKRAEADFPPLL